MSRSHLVPLETRSDGPSISPNYPWSKGIYPYPVARATSKGPPFCHQQGTTSAVVGRVLIVVEGRVVVNVCLRGAGVRESLAVVVVII
jgi:hypothetical protein